MNLGIWEILIILLVIVLLFGARKLPELARSVGRSARIFKSEVKEMKNEDGSTQQKEPQQQEQNFWDRPENKPAALEQQPQPQQENFQQQQNQNNQQQ